MDVVEVIKKDIIDIIHSREFKDLIKDNLKDFRRLIQEVNKEQIYNSEYYWKLGEILNKKREN